MATDQIKFSCTECGSFDFVFPNDPPNGDDIITCAGCNHHIGRYDIIREAAMEAAKTEVDKASSQIFGRPPDWK